MSENIPHSLGGFRGAFESEHGRKPTEQEIWNAAIRSWRDITRQKSDVAKERVVESLLEYAGDNGYMRHAAALLQSTALPDHPEQHLDMAAEIRDLFPVPAPCSALEPAWAEAMANPASVPAYVRACLDARPVGELTDSEIDAVSLNQWGPHWGAPLAAHRAFARAILAAARSQPVQEPLTNAQIEEGRKATFSTDNPFCPCDSKTMRKAVWWAERAHGITQGGKV